MSHSLSLFCRLFEKVFDPSRVNNESDRRCQKFTPSTDYTVQWDDTVRLITARNMEKKALFCIRYSLQASIHTLWRERNKIRYGEKTIPLLSLKKLIEKGVKNKLSLMRGKGGKKLEGIIQFWFTRM